MFFYLYTALIIVVFGAVRDARVAGTDVTLSDACQSWTSVRQSVDNFSKLKVTCDVMSNCSGINCNVKIKDVKGTIEAYVQHCLPQSARPSLVVVARVPQMKMYWTHTFVQSEKIPLTIGRMYGAEMVQVNMQVLNKESIVLGITLLQGDGQQPLELLRNQTIALRPCNWQPTEVGLERKLASPVLIDQDNESKVVLGTVTTDGHSCDMSQLGGCGFGETCEQVAPGRTQGICKCLPHFHRKVDGACEADPTVPSPTVEPSAEARKNNDDEDDNGSLYAVKVGVSIFVVAILLTVLFISAHKYRWVPRIRARFQRARPYEEMVIDGDDGQSNNMSNPVV